MNRALHNTHTLRTFLFLAFFGFSALGWGQATLPVSTTTLSKNSLPTGFTHSDLGNDYTGPHLKFDTQGDWLRLFFDVSADELSFELGVNNTFPGTIPSTAIFTVQESTDGTTWTDLASYTDVAGGAKSISSINNLSRYIRWIYTTKPSGINIALRNISLTALASTSPTITTSVSSLTGFTYVEGSGPSAEQSFDVSGSNLTNDITVTPPSNWEISTTSGSGYQTSALTLTQSAGTVSSTTIYTRMVSGLTNAGSPYSGDIACASGATTQNVAVDGTVTVACVAPTHQATSLVLDNETASSIDGSFTAASPAADGYLVVRSENSSLSGNPVDATTYAVNDALGGGTVVAVGSSTSFTDTGLTANTTYYYFVFAYNDTDCSGGPVYLVSTPLTGNATTLNGPTTLYAGSFENADETWSYISNGGTGYWERSDNGGTYSPGDSGYDGTYYAWFYGYNNDADDWLVSPAYDFSSHTNIEMDFWTWMRNSGPNIQMKISSDYVSGNPSAATWTNVSPTLATSEQTWTNSGAVDLSAFDGENNVHIAFYYSGNDVDRNWAVDDYAITGILNNTPEIEIQGNSIEIVDSDTTPSIADDSDFGNVEVTGGSTAHTFTIKNTGGADLTLTSVTSDNATEFAVSGTTSGAITAGNSSTFTVTFDPTALGTRTATLTVVSDDTDENPYTFTIQGTGTNSASSDIIANAGFSYTSDIDYLSYQADPITNTSHSIGVFGILLRDGGGTADTDALSTELNDLSLSYIGTANTIRAAALFNGNAHLADAVVTANGIAFTGLSGVAAVDDSTLNLTLRVSFTTSVVDNEQLQFTITGATANAAGSSFATANAGGAVSSTTGDRNRIEVVADRLAYSVQPTDQTLNTNLAPFTIIATDVNNNLDLDATNTLTLTTSGGGVMTHSSSYTMSGGQAVVSDVQFDTAQTGITITATTTGLTNNSITSSSFNISDVASGTYRTTAGGTWPNSPTSTWERFNGSAWVVATPSSNTTDLLIIRHNITSNGAFAATGGVGTKMQIETSGTFNAGHNCTFQTMQINSGGTLVITDPAVDILATTGIVTVESGGKVTLNSSTLNNADGFWEGVENFKSGSTLEILNWGWNTSPGEECLIDSDNPISPNIEGYFFGNIIFNATPSHHFSFFRLTGTQKLCTNDLTITNGSATVNVVLANVNTNVEIGGNVIVNGSNTFAFSSITSSDLTHTVKGNIIVNSGTLNINTNSSSSGSTTVNLEGNLQTVSGATLRSTDAGCKIVFNGNGTTQTIDLAGTLGANADFEVANNAVAQIVNQDIDLANASNNFDVLTGGTLEFNYFDITGVGAFEQKTGGILKINSAYGVNATGAIGNVQNTGTRTFSQTGHYHYVGNTTPQSTGTAMSSSSTAKRIVINKDNATDIVNVTQSTGTTNELKITKGVLVETETANISGSGTLTMETDGTYKTAVTSATVPQLSGTYTLNGDSTIELNAAGNQTLRGGKDYRNLTFSVSGTKTITSATANIDGDVYITDDAVLDVDNKTFGGSATYLLMDDNGVFRTAGTGVKPDMSGEYYLDGNSKIVFTNNAGTLQKVRLSPVYKHIEIEGTNVGTETLSTAIQIQTGGSFTVKSNGVFKHSNTSGFNGSTTTAIDNTNSPTITLETNSTVDYAGADQTITHFAPNYAHLNISGTGTKTLAENTATKVGKNLTVAASTLNIESGKTLTVVNQIANDGEIVVAHEGSLVQVNDAAVNSGLGENKIKKTTSSYYPYDYIYWSSPVDGADIGSVFSTVNGFNNYKFKFVPELFEDKFKGEGYPQSTADGDGYDDGGDDWATATGTMTPGLGYIVMGKGSTIPFDSNTTYLTTPLPSYEAIFTGGKFNNGLVEVEVKEDDYNNDITGTGTDGNASWNLNLNFVGNPYPSAIDIAKFFQGNAGVVNNSLYVWTHDVPITTNTGPNAYDFNNLSFITVNYNPTLQEVTQVASSTNKTLSSFNIASGQGFMVSIVNDIALNTKVKFNNGMRVTGNNNTFYKTQETSIDRLWLNMTGTDVFRQLAVAFHESSSDMFISGEDTPKIDSADDTDFYSLVPNNNGHFAIQFLGAFADDKQVPLGVEINQAGSYNIAVDTAEGVFANGQKIYLEDTFTDIIHDLSIDAYTFTAEAATNVNDRFVLRFVNGTAGNSETALATLKVYPNPSTGVFNVSYHGDETLQYSIYDLTGKQIANGTGNQINLSQQAVGMYYAKITDGKSARILKLVRE